MRSARLKACHLLAVIPCRAGSEPRGTAIKRSLARTRQHRYGVQFPEQSTRWAGDDQRAGSRRAVSPHSTVHRTATRPAQTVTPQPATGPLTSPLPLMRSTGSAYGRLGAWWPPAGEHFFPLGLEPCRKIVPLPAAGRVDRCWDVVPARL